MIKRLFRTWLRVKLYKKIGDSKNFERAFSWIYDSPIFEWKLRIYCIYLSTHEGYEYLDGLTKTYLETRFDEASRLWDFFHQ